MLTKILHYKTTIIGKMMSRSGFMTKDRYTSQDIVRCSSHSNKAGTLLYLRGEHRYKRCISKDIKPELYLLDGVLKMPL